MWPLDYKAGVSGIPQLFSTTVVQISEKPEGVSFSLWEKEGRAKREPDRAKPQERAG